MNPREFFFSPQQTCRDIPPTRRRHPITKPRCCGLPFGSRSQYPHHLAGWVGVSNPTPPLGISPSGNYRAGPPGRCGMRIPRWRHDIFWGAYGISMQNFMPVTGILCVGGVDANRRFKPSSEKSSANHRKFRKLFRSFCCLCVGFLGGILDKEEKMTSEPVLMLNVECWMLLISVSWNLTWGACFAHFSGGEHQRSFKPWLTWVSHEKLGKHRTPERQKDSGIRSFPNQNLELQVSSGLHCSGCHLPILQWNDWNVTCPLKDLVEAMERFKIWCCSSSSSSRRYSFWSTLVLKIRTDSDWWPYVHPKQQNTFSWVSPLPFPPTKYWIHPSFPEAFFSWRASLSTGYCLLNGKKQIWSATANVATSGAGWWCKVPKFQKIRNDDFAGTRPKPTRPWYFWRVNIQVLQCRLVAEGLKSYSGGLGKPFWGNIWTCITPSCYLHVQTCAELISLLSRHVQIFP